MKQLLRILTSHSVKALFRYKSFFILILFLIIADRVIHGWVEIPNRKALWPHGYALGKQAAEYVFTQLPNQLLQWVLSPRVVTIIAGLFLLKQVISLWPSSDMRRMHRDERGLFGILEALAALRWHQVAWDALAVGWVCCATAIWLGIAYLTGWTIWSRTGSTFALLTAGTMAALALPLTMAGFSYSSKLAVIRNGTFGTRFRLFLELFMNWRLLWTSWLFFSVRIVVEATFVALIPAGAIVFIDNFWLRISVAALSATPVYAFLKMASFKFFLEAYRDYPLVQLEYNSYFQDIRISSSAPNQILRR